MTIEWNKVTWYSKIAALVVFLATFAIAFNLGILWEQTQVETTVLPTQDVNTPQTVGGGSGAHCGGFIQNAPACAKDFHCQLKISNPDIGGICVAD